MSFSLPSRCHALRRASAIALMSLAAAVAPQAHAVEVTYDLTFSPVNGAVPTGFFTYDAATQDITALSVTWNGAVFTSFFFQDLGAGCGAGDLGLFRLLTTACVTPTIYQYIALNFFGPQFEFTSIDPNALGPTASAFARIAGAEGDVSASGFWTASPRSQVPEPGPLALFSLGLVGLALHRRRAS